jgi:hypothetical protein
MFAMFSRIGRFEGFQLQFNWCIQNLYRYKVLNSVLDEGKTGLFPSPSAIDRAMQILDMYTMETVGCEMTKYGTS